MQETLMYSKTYSILDRIINLGRNPNLSRTHDIEASFTTFPQSNPYLSRILNEGFYGSDICDS